MLAANAPAPTIAMDEDDELFLTLTNVGMTMRPDLFDPHSVHWHGFPQAAAIFDGVPDASISINMGASLTYYYKAKDAGTYMYHCHVEAAEHMQMGMLGNLYVRPRQNRTVERDGAGSHVHANPDWNSVPGLDNPLVATSTPTTTATARRATTSSTRSRSAPSTPTSTMPASTSSRCRSPACGTATSCSTAAATRTPSTRACSPRLIRSVVTQPSQPVSSLITAAPGQRILLRISNLSVTQFYTLGTNGMPMEVVGLDARLLRDGDGNNLYYKTNSLTLGGGQSADVILDRPGDGRAPTSSTPPTSTGWPMTPRTSAE